MLRQDGMIDFVGEIMDLVDEFLRQYEEREGPFRNALEKGLVVSFVLGCIRQDTEAIWDALGQSPRFRGVSPRAIYGESSGESLSEENGLLPGIRERHWLEV